MGLAIFWTQFAEDKLTDIFEYHNYNVGVKVAQNLVTEIIEESLKLSRNPYIGQKEELLMERAQEYRYLVVKSYKIIYWVDLPNQRILVANVFDTRQNPINMNIF